MKQFKKIICGCAAALMLLSSTQVEAQFLWPASSNETMYPSPMMSPSSYNLGSMTTSFLSNFSHAGSGMLMGSTINVDGWSTNNDGGFSLGLTVAGIYTGTGAYTIPNAKDVQVGLLEFAGNYYVIASYYDVNVSLYGYDLYKCAVSPGSITVSSKLYTYYFQDPNVPMPTYISTSMMTIAYPGTIPLTTTMDYNRISMDVNKDIDKVAIVLTDNANGKMYTAVGQVIMDTVVFSSNLPLSFLYPTASGGSTPEVPDNQFFFGTDPFVNTSAGIWDLFDAATSTYVRYYTSGPYTGLYHYSHYPLDMFQYVFEWDGNPLNSGTKLSSTEKGCYSPLIGIKAMSTVTHLSPPNHDYLQYWPDVAFSGDELRYIFYLPEAGFEDIYVSEAGGPGYELFPILYNHTGAGSSPVLSGRNDIAMVFRNTADGRFISPDHFNASGLHTPFGNESKSASLPPTPYNAEIRANIDAPDMASYDYAVTFAYTYSMGASDYIEPDVPIPPPGFLPRRYVIHSLTDFGKHNIYVRYGAPKQSVLTNASLKHVSNTGPFYTAINNPKNIAPDISFKPMSTEVCVAWASEGASLLSGGTGWSYIAAKIDLNTPTILVPGSPPTVTPGTFVNMPDYLYVANTPSFDCGRVPLVALSKHTDGQMDAYTSFTQDDGSDYSIMHKSSAFTNTTTWRMTGTSSAISEIPGLNVGPNPFSASLHIQSSEDVSVNLMDITGRNLYTQSGSATAVNLGLDAKAVQLVPGNYILEAKTVSGKTAKFKVTKQ